eukprot:gene11199-13403_t
MGHLVLDRLRGVAVVRRCPVKRGALVCAPAGVPPPVPPSAR